MINRFITAWITKPTKGRGCTERGNWLIFCHELLINFTMQSFSINQAKNSHDFCFLSAAIVFFIFHVYVVHSHDSYSSYKLWWFIRYISVFYCKIIVNAQLKQNFVCNVMLLLLTALALCVQQTCLEYNKIEYLFNVEYKQLTNISRVELLHRQTIAKYILNITIACNKMLRYMHLVIYIL